MTGERRVIKQINIKQNPKALVKELQVFKLFIERLVEPSQDDKPRESEILGVDELQELISKPDLFKFI